MTHPFQTARTSIAVLIATNLILAGGGAPLPSSPVFRPAAKIPAESKLGSSREILPKPTSPHHAGVRPGREARTVGKLPLSFEPNLGQADPHVRFLARSRGVTTFLTDSEAVTVMTTSEMPLRTQNPLAAAYEPPRILQTAIRMKLEDANTSPEVVGLDAQPGVSNYFRGSDRTKWQTNVPHYARVSYKSIYDGVDMVYYSQNGQMEYDFVVRPGGDPSQIRMAFEGAERMQLDQDGNLGLLAGSVRMQHLRPVVYQTIAGKKIAVQARFRAIGQKAFGFEVGAWNRQYALVLDPVVAYATFVGGGSDTDDGLTISTDSAGRAYVGGYTASTDFPVTAGAIQSAHAGQVDGYVFRVNASGTALEYSTFIGGNGRDIVYRIKANSAGEAYLLGNSTSNNFPTTAGVYQTTNIFGTAAYVAKLNSAGNQLIYSTFLGPTWQGLDMGLDVDASGNVYACGTTTGGFPTTPGAYQSSYAGGFFDAWVAKLNSTGTALIYATLLGGGGDDILGSLAVDSAGNAYVQGNTTSGNFPTTPGAFLSSGNWFVTKINPTGSAVVYSTFIGNGIANGRIAIDPSGNVYSSGYASAPGYPTTPGAFQATFSGGGIDGVISKLNSTGSAILAATYLGGSGDDSPGTIALDAAGNVWVVGSSNSANFPVTPDAAQSTHGGGYDIFLTKFDSSLSTALFSTYWGGSGEDVGYDLALDPAGNAYISGRAGPAFPTVHPLQASAASNSDAIVMKFGPPTDTTPPLITPTITGTLGSNGWYTGPVSVSWSVTDPQSGIGSSTGCGPTTLSASTSGTSLTCSATNGAGLSASVKVTIKIDSALPTIAGMPSAACSLWPPNHKLVVVATVIASAGASGLASFGVTGTSNEPANPGPDIVITGTALQARVVQLRAERLGGGSGRVYTITATATNVAGVTATLTATCVVAHDQGQ